MKKILFPTDFSEVANNAFLYALHLAKKIDAEIITLHVYELPQMDYMDVPVYLLDIYEVTELSNFENYKHHIPVLRNIAEKHHLNDIKISNVLENGNLVDNIHKISEQEHIDYIVMGTKGAEGLAATFLGSVTEKVMHHAKTIVLAIPEHCQYANPDNILFITKFKPADRDILQKVIAIAEQLDARIDCLFVRDTAVVISESVMEDWKMVLENERVTYHTLLGNDVGDSILEFIDNHQNDMLAMPIHDRGFFERLFHISLSKKLAFHVKIPILAIHE
ncbi:MAG: universal stress protein [Burkholderiales bacterium]|nr:universal stress protein [Flavobacterium sp.]